MDAKKYFKKGFQDTLHFVKITVTALWETRDMKMGYYLRRALITHCGCPGNGIALMVTWISVSMKMKEVD